MVSYILTSKHTLVKTQGLFNQARNHRKTNIDIYYIFYFVLNGSYKRIEFNNNK